MRPATPMSHIITRDTAPALALAVALLAFGVPSAGIAAEPQPKPFATGKADAGEALVNKDCISCHAGRFNGDADRIYLRPEHKVRTPAQLMAQVQFCNVQLGTNYFPDEEEHVAAYLNLHFYKFKP